MKRNLTNLFDENPKNESELEKNYKFGITLSRGKKKKEIVINATALNLIGRNVENYVKEILKNELKKTFKINKSKKILVVGLGNKSIKNDSLGPKVAEKLVVSRGLDLAPSVCVFCPNVFSNTGIESFEMVKSVSKSVNPDLVILIDAFATTSVSRLCCSFQVSEDGIVAGSGANLKNTKISKFSLGVKKLISIGVPTLIYASAISEKTTDLELKDEFSTFPTLMLSPTDIGKTVESISRIISSALNETLFPKYTSEEILSITQ